MARLTSSSVAAPVALALLNNATVKGYGSRQPPGTLRHLIAMSHFVVTRASSTESLVRSETEAATALPWRVVVWDDPVTPMSVVVVIFRKIFAYSREKATQLMMTVHTEGRANVWSGQRAQAESFCVRLHAHGLQATIEQDS